MKKFKRIRKELLQLKEFLDDLYDDNDSYNLMTKEQRHFVAHLKEILSEQLDLHKEVK